MSEYTPETLRAQVTVRGSLCQFTGSPWSVLDHADAWEALEKRLEAARNMLKRADAIIALYAYDSGVKVRMGRALHDSSIAWLAEYAREGS
jgi:hypothetical protein